MNAKRMIRTQSTHGPTDDLLNLVVKYKWRWIVPATLVALGVGIFAYLNPDTWEVSQSIIVRNYAVSEGVEPGEFRGADPMRRTVDTIVELCLSSRVLGAALSEVGPPEGEEVEGEWPDREAIANLREAVSVEAPNGAEFGTTEVFFIKVQDNQRERALSLVDAIFRQLRDRTRELRDQRAREMVAEVEEMVTMAESDLQETTQEIKQIEQSVGGDVVVLRMLHASPGGNAEREESLISVDRQIMEYECQHAVNQHLIELLESAKEDPKLLLSAPPDLLTSQPMLQEMITGLAAAKLRTAAMRGNHTENYPTMKTAIKEEAAVRDSIRTELDCTIELIKADIDLKARRREVLVKKRDAMSARMQKLASMRAEYTNLVNVVDYRQRALETAEQRLGEVRIRQVVARTSNIISRLDSPDIGHQPIGPSRAMTLLAGVFGGLVTGFGCLALTVVGRPSGANRQVDDQSVPDFIACGSSMHVEDLRSVDGGCESMTVS